MPVTRTRTRRAAAAAKRRWMIDMDMDSDVDMAEEVEQERDRPEDDSDDGLNVDIEAIQDADAEPEDDDGEAEDDEDEAAAEEDEDEDEDEIQSDNDEEDDEDEVEEAPPRPQPSSGRFKIKLKMPSRSSGAVTPTVESEDSMSTESRQQSVSVPSTTRPMTTRQAVLASVLDSSHVSLGGSKPRKPPLNETELALRKEETARKRRNLTEKRLEDEKLETINRLLKKQSRPRNKRNQRADLDDLPPGGGSANATRSTSVSTHAAGGGRRKKGAAKKAEGEDQENVADEGEAAEAEDEEMAEEAGRELPVPTMYRWISTSRVPSSVQEPEQGKGPAADADASVNGSPGAQRKMVITFSVPVSALPPQPSASSETKNEEDAARKEPSSHSMHCEAPKVCAAPGCGKPRKYRLVKDWTKGACGMDCLKILEASS